MQVSILCDCEILIDKKGNKTHVILCIIFRCFAGIIKSMNKDDSD